MATTFRRNNFSCAHKVKPVRSTKATRSNTAGDCQPAWRSAPSSAARQFRAVSAQPRESLRSMRNMVAPRRAPPPAGRVLGTTPPVQQSAQVARGFTIIDLPFSPMPAPIKQRRRSEADPAPGFWPPSHLRKSYARASIAAARGDYDYRSTSAGAEVGAHGDGETRLAESHESPKVVNAGAPMKAACRAVRDNDATPERHEQPRC